MRTMMMTLAILISACGVDNPKAFRVHADTAGSNTATTHSDTPPGDEPTEEPQPCELTTDCEVGTCDRATRTCVGDEPMNHKPLTDD
jgi:hypothetical protein